MVLACLILTILLMITYLIFKRGGTIMKKILLKKRKIGERLTIGCELEGDEMGFFIANLGVSASCALKIKE